MKPALAACWRYLRQIFGETAYDEYVAHRRRHCPDGRVLSRREFEELRTRPNVRCC